MKGTWSWIIYISVVKALHHLTLETCAYIYWYSFSFSFFLPQHSFGVCSIIQRSIIAQHTRYCLKCIGIYPDDYYNYYYFFCYCCSLLQWTTKKKQFVKTLSHIGSSSTISYVEKKNIILNHRLSSVCTQHLTFVRVMSQRLWMRINL